MQPNEDRPRLTDAQLSAVQFARDDLDTARSANLAEMPDRALILMVERLRGRLDDMLRLIETTHESSRRSEH
ncbi:hypothetical protein M877_28660 [Streptomyces niveus NCIMB 11891]|nr:hypothetical protein M877_28660 [Streptomyces niveus NCIMB 11891]